MTIVDIGPAVMNDDSASVPIVGGPGRLHRSRRVRDAPTHGGSEAYSERDGRRAASRGIPAVETWLMTDLTFG